MGLAGWCKHRLWSTLAGCALGMLAAWPVSAGNAPPNVSERAMANVRESADNLVRLRAVVAEISSMRAQAVASQSLSRARCAGYFHGMLAHLLRLARETHQEMLDCTARTEQKCLDHVHTVLAAIWRTSGELEGQAKGCEGLNDSWGEPKSDEIAFEGIGWPDLPELQTGGADSADATATSAQLQDLDALMSVVGVLARSIDWHLKWQDRRCPATMQRCNCVGASLPALHRLTVEASLSADRALAAALRRDGKRLAVELAALDAQLLLASKTCVGLRNCLRAGLHSVRLDTQINWSDDSSGYDEGDPFWDFDPAAQINKRQTPGPLLPDGIDLRRSLFVK